MPERLGLIELARVIVSIGQEAGIRGNTIGITHFARDAQALLEAGLGSLIIALVGGDEAQEGAGRGEPALFAEVALTTL